jgi:murein DD-endopeptidase MepM/ murein hydrolase activator NlpD
VKSYSGGVRHDYKDPPPSAGASPPRRWSWFAAGLALPLLTVTLFLVSEPNQSKTPALQELAAPMAAAPIELEEAATPPPTVDTSIQPAPTGASFTQIAADATALRAVAEPIPDGGGLLIAAPLPDDGSLPVALSDPALLDLLVERGDTLEILFRRNDLNLSDLAAMVALPEAARHLKLLKPGDRIGIAHRDGRILSLDRELDEIDMLSIKKLESGFEAATVSRPFDVRTVGAHGVIEYSLFEAAMEAGISDGITMDMAGIFQWDIDFIKDVRVGDEFTVIHQELWRDGRKLRNGNIVATEFINRGKSYRAASYEDADGNVDFYTPEGRSVRKAFIRAPVSFTRISSNFNPNRRHPVLNTIRAHRGVDYAAPTGTPVQAAGDGKVEHRGSHGGYGNAIILQHGGNITTLYGHLSRFGKPRVGSRVKQGDIIGYVGQSGLATGPHLHYEYRIAGVHRNPRTVELPAADPVPSEYRENFTATTARLWRQLDLYNQTQVAAATP